MRRVVIRRSDLGGLPFGLPHGVTVSADEIERMLNHQSVPDGLPFLIEDDGSFTGVWSINHYLRDAQRQQGLDLGAMKRSHVYNLARPTRFIRQARALVAAGNAGIDLDAWLEVHSMPKVDLTAMTREELTDYSQARGQEVAATTWNTELGTIAAFFDYAVKQGWVEASPVPRWGQRNRNTLARRVKHARDPKFLNEVQLRHFLKTGLRGDGATERPAHPERDYSYGVLLASTGVRREEGGFLLDCEIPALAAMPSDGIWPFTRIGKGQQPRTVYVTAELVRAIDLYRTVERPAVIRAAQSGLRALRREGRLLVAESVEHRSDGRAVVRLNGKEVVAYRLTDEDRARLVVISDRGDIEPLALFVSRRGLAPDVKHWNETFVAARARAHASGSDQRPPQHITVTPHVMRHTFAVRLLSALMREGQRTQQDPYALMANPVLTVMQLLGHASAETTQRYLYAAERYSEELPAALKKVATVSASRAGEGSEQ